MERPAKRMKMWEEVHYTSPPTRTIPLADLRRRGMPPERPQRQILPRDRHAAALRPRVPDVTVTASVVDVNVKEGTATLASTEITAATTNTVIPVSDLGVVTVPAISTTTSTANITTNGTITSTPSTITSSTSYYTSTSFSTNGTTNSTTENTITVTETSTFEITFSNGTFIPPSTTHTHKNHTATGYHTSNGTLILTSVTSPSSSSIASSIFTSALSQTDSSSSSSIILFPGGSITSTGTLLPTSATSTTPTTTSTPPPSGPGLTPTQQGVVGGVVGGLSGLALVLLGVLMFLRWYRTRLQSRRAAPIGGIFPSRLRDNNGSRRHIRGTSSNGGGSNGGYGYELTQAQPHKRSSSTAVVAAAFANSLRRLTRPHSLASSTDFSTNATTAAGSERGFQKIAGRKLGPVLSTGEDPYGGNYGVFEKDFNAVPAGYIVTSPTRDRQQQQHEQQNLEHNLSRNSFYRGDSRGFYASANSLPGHQTRPSSEPAQAADPTSPRSPQSQNTSTRVFTDNFPMPPVNNTPYALRTPPTSPPPPPQRPFSPRSHSATHLPHTTSPLRPGPTALTRPEGFAVMRPSPARTPTTSSLPDTGAMLGSPTHRSRTTGGSEMFPFPSPPMRAKPMTTDAGVGMGMVEILLDSGDDVPPTPPVPERHGLHHYRSGDGNGNSGSERSSPRGRSAGTGAGQGQGRFLDAQSSGVRAGSSRSVSRFKEVV